MDLFHAHAVTHLETRFLAVSGMTPGLWQEVQVLDRLAFAHQDNDESIRWEEPEWMALGFLEDKIVSQICLHKREITVGEQKVWVGGVGGVATHPDWLRHGFASLVLQASAAWMRDELDVPFGMLFCAEETQPLYAKCDWQTVTSSCSFIQDDQCRQLDTCVMIQCLKEEKWPAGKINLCGLPW